MPHSLYFADLTHTGCGIHARTFPLGIGSVAAYAAAMLQDAIDCRIFKFPETLAVALEERPPAMLCLSHYVWNSELSYAFARSVKQQHPQVVTVFGGPSFPLEAAERHAFLLKHPYIDFYIKWDGEHAFAGLANALVARDMDADALKCERAQLDNCCYVVNGDYVEGPDHRVRDMTALPSPYLSGLLDSFFDSALDVLYETTRGCPYFCTFCNDGHTFRSRVNRKSALQIREELEYIAQHARPAADLVLADLNYGMYKEDLDTSRAIRSLIDRLAWPPHVVTALGKSHPARVLEAVDIVNGSDDGILRFGPSFQTTDSDVLALIKRKNVPTKDLLALRDFRNINDQNLQYRAELILPLPGDTRETHFQSLKDCIEVHGMSFFDIHQLMLLPGTEMASEESRRKFGFDIRHKVFIGAIGHYTLSGPARADTAVAVAEIGEFVVGTNTMPFSDYLDCRVMDLLTKIYFDDSVFMEIFGFIRQEGLSEFDLLVHLTQHHLHTNVILSAFIQRFIGDVKRPFFESREAINAFLAEDGVFERYLTGELGANELTGYRSGAFLECTAEIHQTLENAALDYLAMHNRLTPSKEAYVHQAIRFSRMRKFDATTTSDPVAAHFTFDFIRAQEEGFRVDPDQFKIDDTIIEFYYGEEKLTYINLCLNKWRTDTGVNFAKLYQRSNLRIMERDVRVVAYTAETKASAPAAA